MSAALQTHDIEQQKVLYFSGNLVSDQARVEALKLVASGADCALPVANSSEGAELITALASLGEQMPLNI